MRNYRNIIKRNFIYGFAILLLSLAVFKVFMLIHGPHFEFLSQAAYGVIEGKPHWIAYQNRLLGPMIVLIISKIGLAYPLSLKIFIFATLLIENIVLYTLLIRMNLPPRKSLLWVVLFSSAFIGLQHIFFYPWDCIDLIIFTMFSWGIFQSKSLCFFIPLFCIGILNKESVFFISLYIVIDAFRISLDKFRVSFQSGIKLAVGMVLSILGMIYTKLIRDYLFVSRDNGLDDNMHRQFGEHVYFMQNVHDFFINNIKSLDIINSVFVVFSTAYMIYLVRRCGTDASLKAMIIYIAIMAGILVFGLINESRVYFILIPFLVFFTVYMKIPLFKASIQDSEVKT